MSPLETDPADVLRLGTRGSQLALWQANTVARLIAETGGPRCEVIVIRTDGDRLQDRPLSEIGGKRLFVKEIEDALLRRDIDLAVHSSKDMPAVLPAGLVIAGVLPREDPLDAVVLPEHVHLETDATIPGLLAVLGQTPTIGTGSVRRIAQLTRLMPGAHFAPIRGNLDTRLRKLDEGGYDALVLAAAGLHRLGCGSRISLALPAGACVPAPGQGIVAMEMRSGDDKVAHAVARIDDAVASAALSAERAVVEALGGGCQTPIGALASPIDDRSFELVAVVAALDGSRILRSEARGSWRDAAAIGAKVADQLLSDGAGDILAEDL